MCARQPEYSETVPSVSVVLMADGGTCGLPATLRSLAHQDLEHERFEIVIVIGTDDAECWDAASIVTEEHSELRIRWRRLATSNNSAAYVLGAASAHHEFCMFMRSGDTISKRFLSTALVHAQQDVIVCCPTASAGSEARQSETATTPDPESVEAQRIRSPTRLLTDHVANLFSSSLVPPMADNFDLSVGMGAVYWADLIARYRLEVKALPPTSDLEYVLPVDSKTLASTPDRRRASDHIRVALLIGNSPTLDSESKTGFLESQAMALQSLLARDPELLREVLTEIIAAGIANFPYHLLTNAPARLLAVLYSFPPTSDTSAIVAARRLRERGEIFDVVCNDFSGVKGLDDGPLKIVQGLERRRHVVEAKASYSDWKAIQKYVEEGLRVVEAWQEEQGPYQQLYSRAQWLASHFLAAAVKIRNPDIHWVAEFSDPLLHSLYGGQNHAPFPPNAYATEFSQELAKRGLPIPESRNLFEWAETVAYALADVLVFTNRSQAELMATSIKDTTLQQRVRDRARVEPHPTLPDAFYQIENPAYALDPRRVNIAYFGQFLKSRGIDEIIQALQLLAPDARRHIQLHAFVPFPDKLSAEMFTLGLNDTVIANGYVTYLESLALATRFDCLLVNDASTREIHPYNPYLPSKLADYQGAGRPIWTVYEPGSPASLLALDFRSERGDSVGAARVLGDLIRMKSSRDRATTSELTRAPR